MSVGALSCLLATIARPRVCRSPRSPIGWGAHWREGPVGQGALPGRVPRLQRVHPAETARATPTRTARPATRASGSAAGPPSGCWTRCAPGRPPTGGGRCAMTGRARTHARAVARGRGARAAGLRRVAGGERITRLFGTWAAARGVALPLVEVQPGESVPKSSALPRTRSPCLNPGNRSRGRRLHGLPTRRIMGERFGTDRTGRYRHRDLRHGPPPTVHRLPPHPSTFAEMWGRRCRSLRSR